MQPRRLAVFVLILALSLSCTFLTGEPTPTPREKTPTPPTEPPTQAPAAPTDTPAPPTPPTGLNPDGPYVLYGGQGGIWISNPDGSFLTQLTDLPINSNDLRSAVSPQGDRLVLVVKNDTGIHLIEVSIPDGKTRNITRLHSLTPQRIMENPTSDDAFAAYAIGDYPNIAWQPGSGKLLAFVGAVEGPTSDLYLYNVETGEISQMTDGESQAIMPTWSPDGEFILHFGVSWVPPFGGALVGYNRLDGIWSVRASDGEVINMPVPRGGQINFVGWQDESHYVTFDSGEPCYAENLHSVDAASGETAPIMDMGFYSEIALSPESGAFLFTGDSACKDSPGDGIYLLLPGQQASTRLLDKKAWEIRWMPESHVFFAYPEALFSAEGFTRYDPPVYDKSFHPAVSMQGYQAWEVIENYQGRVVVKVQEADWKSIYQAAIEQLIWDPLSGQTLLILTQEGELLAATYPDFTPRPLGNIGRGPAQIIWLP